MGDGSGGANTADSYIGSLISLTSKSEIRYEGILFMVDTENSNIALQNVRSFGTEGRKKDGPPIYASDKVFEYIVFRGSDIKDLQVKSSPSVQPPPPQPPTDPAIVSLQSQASQPLTIPATYVQPPPPGPQDAPPQRSYPGLPPSAYRPGVPQMYQPAAWGPHGGPNGNLAMPMYWPGYYRPPGGQLLPQQMPPQPPQLPPTLPQPPLPQGPGVQQMPSRPSPPLNLNNIVPLPSQLQSFSTSAPISTAIHGIIGSVSSTLSASVSASAQTTVVPNLNSLPGNNFTTPLVPPSIAPAAASTALPASTAPPSAVGAAIVPPVSVAPTVTAPVIAPAAVQGVTAVITPASKNPRRAVGPGHPTPPQSQSSGASGGSSSAAPATPIMASVTSAFQRSQAATQAFAGGITAQIKTSAPPPNPPKQDKKLAEPLNPQFIMSAPVQTMRQESQPLLPLPTAPLTQRQGNGSGAQTYVRRGGRGRVAGSGRGIGVANSTQQFTEDFDFTAMNEKFNKDAVWGVLGGKGDKLSDAEDEEFSEGHVEDDTPDGIAQKGSSDLQKMPTYVKDDFFDCLSCDALDREGGRSERTKFSEQRKIDTETFGTFPMRSRGGRRGGRRGAYRGGFYNGSGGGFVGGRGSSYGRGRGSSRPATAIN